MQFLKYTIYCVLLVILPLALRAQATFGIQVSAKEIFRNDVLQVEYAIENANAISDFASPVFRGWHIESGPMISQQQSIVNGASSRKTSYQYTLAPDGPGVHTVPGTSVMIAGKRNSCSAVQIKVINKDNPSPVHTPPPASSQLQSLLGEELKDDPFSKTPVLKHGDDVAAIMRSNCFIKVTSSKKTCYVGEPVMVTYQLYSGLPGTPTAGKPPYFKGCSVTEIPFDQEFTTEKVGNKIFRVAIVRKVQLIPLQAGALSLGEQNINHEVVFKLQDEQYRSQPYKLTVKNQPATIEVLPLPPKPPAGFDGIVGQFTITAQPKQSSIPVQENNVLIVTISGKGNLAGIIDTPFVNWTGSETDHFDATTKDDINNTVFPFEGYRSFEIPFVGTREGNVQLPPVQFSYFDPERRRYETIQSDSIRLNFTKATGKSYRDDPAFREDRTTRRYIWIVPALALLVIAILFLNSRQEKKKKASVIQATEIVEARPVIQIDFRQGLEVLSRIEDHQLFFNKCKELASQAIIEKTGQPSDAPVPRLLTALANDPSAGNGAELATTCREFFTDCDLALYAPAAHNMEKDRVLEQLSQLLEQLKATSE